LSAADLSLVTRQLATLVKSSLPLERRCLPSRSRRTSRNAQHLLGVRSKVMEGHTLATARGLERFPGLLRDGRGSEQSGHLDAVSKALHNENREELRSRTLWRPVSPPCVAIVFFLLVTP
jgi:general secretion pathway protein F